jgi:hypothetical protein
MKNTYLILLYVCVLLFQQKRYHGLLPTIPIYPSNTEEIPLVKDAVRRRTQSQTRLFELTDESVSYAFQSRVPESLRELQSLIWRPQVILPIFFFKYTSNRARPKQVDPTLASLHSETAWTPVYPSGHAFQAYYLAHILSQRYPEKKKELWSLAEDCAHSRVAAGLHYPSDNVFAQRLVNVFYV